MSTRASNFDRLFFNLVAFLFFVFVFFPYFAFVPLGSDTQPNAVVFGALILLFSCRNLRLPTHCWVLGLVALMAAGIFLLSPTSFAAQRSLFGYISLFLVSAATYASAQNGFQVADRFLGVTIWAWLLMGLAQLLISPDFGTALLSAARTTEMRGVVSFAVEPGYYGSMMYFVLLILIARKKELSLLGLLCVGQIVFLAQSMVVVLALGITALFYVILKLPSLIKNIYFAAMIAILTLSTPIIVEYFEKSRIEQLMLLFLDNPSLIFMVDASGNQRASAIFFSLKGSIDNFLLPSGFTAYPDYVESVTYEYRNIFLHVADTDRIMSGYGAAFFELGLFGLFIPVIISLAIFQHFRRTDLRQAIVLNIGVHAILFTAVPLALPIIGFFIGYLLATPAEQTTSVSSVREQHGTPAAEPL